MDKEDVTHTHTHTHTHTYTQDYYSVLRENKVLPFETAWMNLKWNKSDGERQITWFHSYLKYKNKENKQSNTKILNKQNKNKIIYTENRLVVSIREGSWRWVEWMKRARSLGTVTRLWWWLLYIMYRCWTIMLYTLNL